MFSGQGQNNHTQEKDSCPINFMSDVGYVGQNAREREMRELGLIGVVD